MITHKICNTEKNFNFGYDANFPIIMGDNININIIIFADISGAINIINPAFNTYTSSAAAENDT